MTPELAMTTRTCASTSILPQRAGVPHAPGARRQSTASGFIRFTAFLACILLASPSAGRVWALSVTAVNPAGYQVAALGQDSACYIDATASVTSIPPALVSGTLIRTRTSDASDPSLVVSFQVDVRAEVYVCCESGVAPPAWLASWVRTDMTVDVSGGTVAGYSVYAKRFDAGTVQLSQNQAGAMYFVVVKESLPIFPRNGWVLLSYDMPYLREIIKQAPEYHVNHIQISHDIMMYVCQPVKDLTLRADINELTDLAHAYGITDVTVWTHEFGTGPTDPNDPLAPLYRLPAACRENNSPSGRVDGDDPETWAWTKNNYDQLFAVCPEVDGVVVTFSENEGCDVWNTGCFKFTGSTAQKAAAEAVQKVIETVQSSCHAYGKTCYARTWAGENQFDVRDGIVLAGDQTTWMMNKNVGGDAGWDWQYMDTHLAVIGTLPAGFNEMIEFDLCGEYLGRSQYTFNMTAYLKEHWNYAYNLGVRGGMVARIDREGALTSYTSNRIHLHAMDRILADRNADPAAVDLAWCQRYFPADAAQDIADHYDDHGSSWQDDTRYLTWEAFFPGLSPTANTQAVTIGRNAIARLDKHRAQLEIQSTLDTRNRHTDYEILRNGITVAILDLGGAVPEAFGYSNFRPARTESLNPDCLVDVRLAAPGLKPGTAACEYSTDGGATWSAWPVTCTGSNGTTATQTLTATAVPFNQLSEDRNFIRFHVADMNGVVCNSGVLRVRTVPPVAWSGFQPQITMSLTPDCTVAVATAGQSLDPATARYRYSTDGGQTWITPSVNWEGRYECDVLPEQAGWTKVEGNVDYYPVWVSNGILHIDDNQPYSGCKIKFARFWNADSQVGTTVEARMQCISGGHYFGCNLQPADGLHAEAFYLKANGMIGTHPTRLLVPANTSDWHTYRVTTRGTDFNVYVDGNPRPVLPGQGFFHQIADRPHHLLFGSGSSEGIQYICYDYLYWTTAGAFPPGPWQAAAYNGGPQGGTITAAGVPFNQYSTTRNKIQFSIDDVQGHTWQSPVYNVSISDGLVWADFNHDGDVDQEDFAHLQVCISGPGTHYEPGCEDADSDSNGAVDSADLVAFQRCVTGKDVQADPSCAQ